MKSLANSANTSVAPSDSFLDNGKIAALYGAKAGWKRRTVRESFSNCSSSYASHKNANVTRSAPKDGLDAVMARNAHSFVDQYS